MQVQGQVIFLNKCNLDFSQSLVSEFVIMFIIVLQLINDTLNIIFSKFDYISARNHRYVL